MRLDAVSPGSPARLCGEPGFPPCSTLPSAEEVDSLLSCRRTCSPKGDDARGGSPEGGCSTALGLRPYGERSFEEVSASPPPERSQQRRPIHLPAAPPPESLYERALEPNSWGVLRAEEPWNLNFYETCSTAVDSERAISRFLESPAPETPEDFRARTRLTQTDLPIEGLLAMRRSEGGNESPPAQNSSAQGASAHPPRGEDAFSRGEPSPPEATARGSRSEDAFGEGLPQAGAPSPQTANDLPGSGVFGANQPSPQPPGVHVRRHSVSTQEFVVTSQSQVQQRVEVSEQWVDSGQIFYSGEQGPIFQTASQPVSRSFVQAPDVSLRLPAVASSASSYGRNEVGNSNVYTIPAPQVQAHGGVLPPTFANLNSSVPQLPSQLLCEPRFEVRRPPKALFKGKEARVVSSSAETAPALLACVQEKVIHRPRINYVDKIVEVDQVEYREKFVEVPQIVLQEKVVHRPKIVYEERIRTVPVPQFVEVLKDKVEVVYEHKYVDVPQVLLQDEVVEQPVVQVVEKIVQVPKPVYVEKIVEVPRTQHRPVYKEKFVEVPVVQTVYQEKLVPVPQKKYNYLPPPPVYVPVEKRIPRIVKIPQPQDVYEVVEKPVYVNKYVDKPYPVFTERVVEEPYTVEVRREVPRPVPYPVYREIRRPVVQQSDILIRSHGGGLVRLEDFAREHNILNLNSTRGAVRTPPPLQSPRLCGSSASEAWVPPSPSREAFSSPPAVSYPAVSYPAVSYPAVSSVRCHGGVYPQSASFLAPTPSPAVRKSALAAPLSSPREVQRWQAVSTQRDVPSPTRLSGRPLGPERLPAFQSGVQSRVQPAIQPVVHSTVQPVVHSTVQPVHSLTHSTVQPVVHSTVQPVVHSTVQPASTPRPVPPLLFNNEDCGARLERIREYSGGDASAQLQSGGPVGKRFDEQAEYLQRQIPQTPRYEESKPRQLQVPTRVEVFVQQVKNGSPSGFVDAYPLSPR